MQYTIYYVLCTFSLPTLYILIIIEIIIIIIIIIITIWKLLRSSSQNVVATANWHLGFVLPWYGIWVSRGREDSVWSDGLWQHEVWQMGSSVSEGNIAYIFRDAHNQYASGPPLVNLTSLPVNLKANSLKLRGFEFSVTWHKTWPFEYLPSSVH